MRTLRRNTVRFQYKANTGEETEVTRGDMHTGEYDPVYADPVEYRGNISAPSGVAQANLFGINTPYTHVLVMDDPKADIREDGLVVWNGDEYEVRAVRPSLNVLNVALRKRTKNYAPPADDEEETSPTSDDEEETTTDTTPSEEAELGGD